MNLDKDYYATLGVLPSIDEVALTAVYRALLKKYHPDVFQGSRDKAEALTKEINEAYEVLGSSTKRRAYDAARGAPRTVGGAYPRSENPGKNPHGRTSSGPSDRTAAESRATASNYRRVAQTRQWPTMVAAALGLLIVAGLYFGHGKSQPGPASAVAPPGADTISATPAEYGYEQGVQSLLQKHYEEAELAFRTFASQHATDPLARRAQDWLGMTYLLRLGVSFGEEGRAADACDALDKVVDKYLNGQDADTQKVLAVVNSEKKRIACF